MRRRRIYVVGFNDDHCCVYGRDNSGDIDYCDPMIKSEIKKKLKAFSEPPTIYRLVVVNPDEI